MSSFKPAAIAVSIIAATAILSFPAAARLESTHHVRPITVSVNFNSQVPLSRTDQAAIDSVQRMGRQTIYRMAKQECTVLREIIAESCALTSLTVSTQVRPQNNAPATILINGSVQFTITLKAD